METWSKPLPDGSRAVVKRASGPAEAREYIVMVVKPDGRKVGACKVGEDGVPIRWYDMAYDRAAVEAAMADLPEALLVERVHET